MFQFLNACGSSKLNWKRVPYSRGGYYEQFIHESNAMLWDMEINFMLSGGYVVYFNFSYKFLIYKSVLPGNLLDFRVAHMCIAGILV